MSETRPPRDSKTKAVLPASSGDEPRVASEEPPKASQTPKKLPRVAVVMAGVLPEQLVLWEVCNTRNAAITIIGTDKNVYEGQWPWQPRRPRDLETILLRPMTPGRLLAKGQVWWLYRGLGTALRNAKPDLIHVLSEPWGGLIMQTLLVRRFAGQSIPTCIHSADNIYWHGSRIERYVRGLILRRVLPLMAGFASWNREGVQIARHAGLGDIPTTVLPTVVPDPETLRARLTRIESKVARNDGPPG